MPTQRASCASTSPTAQYYGVAAGGGDQGRRTNPARAVLMEKLVPTSQVETSLTDLTAAGQQQLIFDAASGESVLTRNMALNDAAVLYAVVMPSPPAASAWSSAPSPSATGHAVQRRARRRHRRLRPWRAAFCRDRRLRLVDAVLQGLRESPGGRHRQHGIAINNRSYNYSMTILLVLAPARCW